MLHKFLSFKGIGKIREGQESNGRLGNKNKGKPYTFPFFLLPLFILDFKIKVT